MSERELVEGLRRDDRECLASIYDLYAGLAYGLALRTLGSQAEAEDVVQESFLALWRQAEGIDPARGIRSYLLSVVHNKTVDRLRRRGRRAEVALDLDAPIAAKEPDPQEQVGRQLEAETVRAALMELPQEQRAAVTMTYFGGMTINEAATQLGVPLGTVKSRLRLAMNRLRLILSETNG